MVSELYGDYTYFLYKLVHVQSFDILVQDCKDLPLSKDLNTQNLYRLSVQDIHDSLYIQFLLSHVFNIYVNI